MLAWDPLRHAHVSMHGAHIVLLQLHLSMSASERASGAATACLALHAAWRCILQRAGTSCFDAHNCDSHLFMSSLLWAPSCPAGQLRNSIYGPLNQASPFADMAASVRSSTSRGLRSSLAKAHSSWHKAGGCWAGSSFTSHWDAASFSSAGLQCAALAALQSSWMM